MKALISWLVAATITTIAFGTIYAGVQQSVRQGANSPQIQMAEDASRVFDRNGADRAVPNMSVNLADDSLTPFILVYDRDGKRLAGNAVYDDASRHNEAVNPPNGVFGRVKDSKTQNRFTWEDKYGTRIAAVLVKSDKGYVLAGRNMREIENIEGKVFKLTLAGWLVSILVLVLGYSAQYAWGLRRQK